MSDTYRIVGTGDDAGNIQFGTAGAGYSTVGQVQSGERTDGTEILELKTRNGNVFAVIYFNSKGECSITAIWDSDFTPPVFGDAISLCALTTVLVKQIKYNWSVGKEASITIEATKYSDALTVS